MHRFGWENRHSAQDTHSIRSPAGLVQVKTDEGGGVSGAEDGRTTKWIGNAVASCKNWPGKILAAGAWLYWVGCAAGMQSHF